MGATAVKCCSQTHPIAEKAQNKAKCTPSIEKEGPTPGRGSTAKSDKPYAQRGSGVWVCCAAVTVVVVASSRCQRSSLPLHSLPPSPGPSASASGATFARHLRPAGTAKNRLANGGKKVRKNAPWTSRRHSPARTSVRRRGGRGSLHPHGRPPAKRC